MYIQFTQLKIINALTLAIIALLLMFYSYIPIEYRSGLYAISLTIKDLILMVLPFVIFSFLLDIIIKMKAKAAKLLIVFVLCIVASNTIAITMAYFIGTTFLPNVQNFSVNQNNMLQPLWSLHIPQILATEYAMPLSIVIGILLVTVFKSKAEAINKIFYGISDVLIGKIIMPIVPIFVAGFIVKIASDKMLAPIFDHYLYTFLLITFSSLTYVSLIYWILTGRKFFSAILNILPSLATAFSTMSSALTLPSLIVASEKNTNNSHVANAILPPAANFHVMGDAFSLTIPIIAIIYTFTGNVMGAHEFLLYLGYFLIFRFATVGIPGGGVIVLLPVLKQHFDFTPEMLTLITTLYIIFDPIQTILNIFGNGAFAILFGKMYKK